MKTIALTTVMILATIVPAFSADNGANAYMPLEYIGYAEYQSVDAAGRAVVIKTPIRYRRETNRDYAEDDSNNAVRDCRIELERAKQEKEESEKRQSRYSAKYYPMYYDH